MVYRRPLSEWAHFDEADRDAIALRHDFRPRPTSGQPKIIFLIALIARAQSPDWKKDTISLRRTLASLTNQTDPDWQAMVCCQDRPDVQFDDPRISYVPFVASPGNEDRFDKNDKRAALLDLIADTETGDGYAHALDADDVIARRYVEHVRATDNGRGYLINRGFLIDSATTKLEEFGLRGFFSGLRPFWERCGSGGAIYFDMRQGGPGVTLAHRTITGRHRRFPMLAHEAGFPVATVPFHAALWVKDEGMNRSGVQLSDGTSRSEPEHLAILEREFRWSEITEASKHTSCS